MPETCEHLEGLEPSPAGKAAGCEDCLAIGGRWVHLRVCEACGHVGCCDSSPNRHARQHAQTRKHPVIRSGERGEAWLYCFDHDLFVG